MPPPAARLTSHRPRHRPRHENGGRQQKTATLESRQPARRIHRVFAAACVVVGDPAHGPRFRASSGPPSCSPSTATSPSRTCSAARATAACRSAACSWRRAGNRSPRSRLRTARSRALSSLAPTQHHDDRAPALYTPGHTCPLRYPFGPTRTRPPQTRSHEPHARRKRPHQSAPGAGNSTPCTVGQRARQSSASVRSSRLRTSRVSQHAIPRREQMATGTVKCFSDENGVGFIKPNDESKNLFVHHSAIAGNGFKSFAEARRVSYDAEQGPNSPAAKNFRHLGKQVAGVDGPSSRAVFASWPFGLVTAGPRAPERERRPPSSRAESEHAPHRRARKLVANDLDRSRYVRGARAASVQRATTDRLSVGCGRRCTRRARSLPNGCARTPSPDFCTFRLSNAAVRERCTGHAPLARRRQWAL